MTVTIIYIIVLTACSSEPVSGLPEIYLISQECVNKQLVSPTSAEYPDYDESFVEYNSNVLEDLGEGEKLEYRVYDVNAYVDSQNALGVVIRKYFLVQVYCYVDDYNTPEFGEEGIHKGIDDHYYSFLRKIE